MARPAFFIGCVLILCWFFVRYVESYAISRQKNVHISRSYVLSRALDLNDIKNLTGQETDTTNPSYIHLKDQLSRIVKADPQLRLAYLMGMRQGNVIFLVDSEPSDSTDYSAPGEIYSEASADLRLLFAKKESLVEGPLKGKWGTWVSTLTPIQGTDNGQVMAVFGLDIDATIWKKEILIYRTFAIVICIFISGILLISQLFLLWQRKIIRKMAESEERFRNIADGSGDWIWETDRNGLYSYSSYAVNNILGYEAKEIIGKKLFYDLTFSDEKEQAQQDLLNKIKGGFLPSREVIHRRHKDGHEVILEVRRFAIRNREGEIVGYRGVDRDVTEVKKTENIVIESKKAFELANKDLAANERVLLDMIKDMEEKNKALALTQNQLIQSEKMATVGVLASGVAHEIKNPLAIILQGIERIEKGFLKTDSANTQYVKIVKDAAVRANKVIAGLLQFSRSSQLETHPLKIHEVVDAAITLIESKAKASNVKVQCHYTSEPHVINGDNIVLEQVFFNLFANAIDAMPEGGDITVTTRLHQFFETDRRDKRIVIEFKDTGVGIAPEYIERIFDPFFTTKEPGKGTGLGLSTVYLILERHNGTIKVESQVGKGTTFIITLPVVS